jgi:hypothetical protein
MQKVLFPIAMLSVIMRNVLKKVIEFPGGLNGFFCQKKWPGLLRATAIRRKIIE